MTGPASYPEPPAPAFLFDLDGTLIDSVYQHVIAWRAALSRLDIDLSVWRIHRRIGMSGGLFVSALLRETGLTLSAEDISMLQQAHAEEYLAQERNAYYADPASFHIPNPSFFPIIAALGLTCVMAGLIFGYALSIAMVVLGLPPAVGLVLSTATVFVLGLGVYPLLIAPLQKRLGRRAPGPLFLVLTLGLSALMQKSMLAAAGGEYLKVPPAVKGGLDFTFTFVSNQRVLIVVVAGMSLAALFLFLRFHRQGMAIRAVAQNPAAAQSVGISLPRVFTLTIGLACALAGLAGGLIAPLFSVYPAVGFTLTIKAFAITILGGMGNVLGAFVASLIIAVVEALSVFVIPSEWQNAIAFGTMILVLLVRPSGLFGKKQS